METIRAEKHNLTQIFVFSATFFSLFQYLQWQYMPRKYSWFINLQPKYQIGTVIRIISSFHAAVATILSIFILLTDEGLEQNKLLYTSFGISFTLNVSIGFLAYDCLIMFIHRNEFEWAYAVHHCVSIIAFYACTTIGVFPYIALCRLISEASTVFINNRWILLTLNKKDSRLYFWNGIAVILVFFTVRIVAIIPNWLIFFDLMDTPAWNSVGFRHKFICVGSSGPLDILNVYWFIKIIKTIVRHSRQTKPRKHNTDLEELNLLRKKLMDSNDSLVDSSDREVEMIEKIE